MSVQHTSLFFIKNHMKFPINCLFDYGSMKLLLLLLSLIQNIHDFKRALCKYNNMSWLICIVSKSNKNTQIYPMDWGISQFWLFKKRLIFDTDLAGKWHISVSIPRKRGTLKHFLFWNDMSGSGVLLFNLGPWLVQICDPYNGDAAPRNALRLLLRREHFPGGIVCFLET